MTAVGTKRRRKPLDPTNIREIDRLAELRDEDCSIAEYVKAASAYITQSRNLKPGPKKSAQIRLSNALGRALVRDLKLRLPELRDVVVGERRVAGALRTVNADVSEVHEIDGLRLAVELKPVNLAVGRAIWNRFGDIRTFATNVHLKFPFCIVGGVLSIPTYENIGDSEALTAELAESADDDHAHDSSVLAGTSAIIQDSMSPGRRSTIHLIQRAIARLVRAGGRKTEGDAPHLLEGIAVVVYDPDTATMIDTIPPKGSSLRWDEFVDSLAEAYRGRFEEV
jgi:hypothetical protein